MLLKHKVFMKLYSDTKLSQLSRAELVDELKKIHELEDHELHESDEHMREKLEKYQRTRNLIFWHDGLSLSSHSHILIATARKTIFSFSRRPEKMIFPKRFPWNMIFLVLSGKMIFFFPKI